MALDLRELIPIRTFPKSIEAQVFNGVRLALLRGSDPLYLDVTRFNIEFQLEREVWLGRSIINGMAPHPRLDRIRAASRRIA